MKLTRAVVYPSRRPEVQELLLEWDHKHFDSVQFLKGSTPEDVAAALRMLADLVERRRHA